MIKFKSFKDFLKSRNTKPILSLKEELTKVRGTVIILLDDILGEAGNFQDLSTFLERDSKQYTEVDVFKRNIEPIFKRIKRWSPKIGRAERKEIAAVRELEAEIKKQLPDFYREIISSQAKVEILLDEIFIKNFPRHFGRFHKSVKKIKSTTEFESIRKAYKDLYTKFSGLVAALEEFKNALDIESRAGKMKEEVERAALKEQSALHHHLGFMYLKDNISMIKKVWAAFFDNFKEKNANKLKTPYGEKKIRFEVAEYSSDEYIVMRLYVDTPNGRAPQGDQIIFNNYSFIIKLFPHVDLNANKEGFLVEVLTNDLHRAGNKFSGFYGISPNLVKGYFEDLQSFIEKYCIAFSNSIGSCY